eukprot:359833-Chlamydomonas_euryale.AAC.25
MLHSVVEVDVSTQLVHLLARVRVWVGMEATPLAVLHQRQPPWRGETEDSEALGRVGRRHDDRDRLVQHCLVAALRVDVHTRQEARLRRVRVDPAQWIELALQVHRQHVLLRIHLDSV